MGRSVDSRVDFFRGSSLHKINITDFEIDKYDMICLNQGGFPDGRSEGFAMCSRGAHLIGRLSNLNGMSMLIYHTKIDTTYNFIKAAGVIHSHFPQRAVNTSQCRRTGVEEVINKFAVTQLTR